MNLYFVKLQPEPKKMVMDDYVVLAPSKKEAEDHMVRISGRVVIKQSTRLVPNGQYLVSETFINSET